MGRCKTYRFAYGTLLLCPLLSTRGAEVCVHEANLARDGLGQNGDGCGVISLQREDVDQDQSTHRNQILRIMPSIIRHINGI